MLALPLPSLVFLLPEDERVHSSPALQHGMTPCHQQGVCPVVHQTFRTTSRREPVPPADFPQDFLTGMEMDRHTQEAPWKPQLLGGGRKKLTPRCTLPLYKALCAELSVEPCLLPGQPHARPCKGHVRMIVLCVLCAGPR